MRSRVRERRTHGSVRGLRREPLVYSTIGLIKVQNRAAVASIDNPAALSVIAPYPAFCGAVVPAVPAARYCKHSF